MGICCCFTVQANGLKKSEENQPVNNLPQNRGKPDVKQVKASSSKVHSASSCDMAKSNLEMLDSCLKEPGRKIGLEKLLEYTVKEAENCFEINPGTVKKMFILGTALNHIEREVGEKFFSSKEEFLAAGAERANNDTELLRVADILNIRRWELKQKREMPTSIDELLKKQRSDRSLTFFHVVSKKLKQLNSGDSKDNNELVKLQKKVKNAIEVEIKKIEGEDKKFDQNKLYNDVLDIARNSKGNSEINIYFSALVNPAEQPLVQEGQVKKKKGGWLS